MKLSDQILRKPFYVAFGQALQGGGITSVDLVATRDATTVTMTASDGSAAPIAGADANTAGVMTAADKSKLDGLTTAVTHDFAAKLDVATSTIGAGVTHLRTAGHSAVGDGGAAVYKRVGSEPSHNLKVQSADLAWWEILPTNNIIPFQAAGGIEGDVAANGAANVTAFNNFIGYAQAYFAVADHADGPTLQFTKGHFHFDNHLNVKAAVRIQGAGTYGEGARYGTILEFATNLNGIIIQNATTIDETVEVSTFQGVHSIIENLQITGGGASNTTGHGIWLRGAAKVRNCRVTDFGLDGIHIVATSGGGGAIEGNANQWGLEDVTSKSNGRHGVYVDGADVNAGAALRVDASGNARWGIFDSSFLGNSWIGCHASSNGLATLGGNAADASSYVTFAGARYSANATASEADLVATTPGTNETVWIKRGSGGLSGTIPVWEAAKPLGTYFHGGSYHTDNVNARSAFRDCYREDNQGENQVFAPSFIDGGLQQSNKANGYAVIGTPSGATITGSVNFANDETYFETSTRQLDLGINTGLNKLIKLDPGTGFIDLLEWNETDGTFQIAKYNNATTPISITSGETTASINAGRASTLPGGEVLFPRGFFFGDHRFSTRHMTNGTAAPSSGEHARGDLVWNRSAAAGGVLGWVCVTTGVPGTWVEIRGVGTQTSGADQTALTNSTGGIRDGTLVAVGDTSTADQSAAINGNLTELHTLLDEVRTTLVNFGLMKGGV